MDIKLIYYQISHLYLSFSTIKLNDTLKSVRSLSVDAALPLDFCLSFLCWVLLSVTISLLAVCPHLPTYISHHCRDVRCVCDLKVRDPDPDFLSLNHNSGHRALCHDSEYPSSFYCILVCFLCNLCGFFVFASAMDIFVFKKYIIILPESVLKFIDWCYYTSFVRLGVHA